MEAASLQCATILMPMSKQQIHQHIESIAVKGEERGEGTEVHDKIRLATRDIEISRFFSIVIERFKRSFNEMPILNFERMKRVYDVPN